MRAVTGRILSSRPISLSRAAKVVSLFSASGTAAVSRPEVAAYVRRTSAAFDELVSFHRELESSHSSRRSDGSGGGELQEVSTEERRRKFGGDGDEENKKGFDGGKPMEVPRNGDVDRGNHEMKNKKRKYHGTDRTEAVNSKEEKMVVDKKRNDFDNGIVLVDDVNIGSEERKKRKKLDKDKNRHEVSDEKIAGVREEMGREEGKKNKEKKNMHAKENLMHRKDKKDNDIVEDQSEQHREKKKNKKRKEKSEGQ